MDSAAASRLSGLPAGPGGFARSVEQLELVPETLAVQPSPLDQQQEAAQASEEEPAPRPSVPAAFAGETSLISERLDAFRDNPISMPMPGSCAAASIKAATTC